MRTAYAIVSGEYSDYRVLAIAEDAATAERWASAVRNHPDSWHSDASVEEFALIPAGTEPQTIHRFDLVETWWDDGRTVELRVSEGDELPIDSLYGPPPARPSVRFVRAPCHRGKGGRIEIRGRTRASVMKVYSEQKAMWKALPQAFKVSE